MIREIDGTRFHLAVVSGGRPANVPAMYDLVGEATWFVSSDVADYAAAGRGLGRFVRCEDVGYPGNRQAALDAAWELGLPSVEIDDDLLWVRRCWPGSTVKPEPIDPLVAIAEIVERVADSPFHLGGAAPTTNAYFSRRATTTRGFVRSGIRVVEPSEPRVDLSLPVKDDYDLCLQHVARYGGLVRCDDLLFNFRQRTNRGGCYDLWRSDANERAIAALLAKWPGQVVRHARREGEISLRLESIPREIAT